VTLALLLVVLALLTEAGWFHAREAGRPPASQQPAYLYYVLKDTAGFYLARARKGTDNQPVDSPVRVASFGDGFGQASSDTVLGLHLSPDGQYLAIDSERADSEQIWIFAARQLTLVQRPGNASGTFLHWLPGNSDIFLFRPMFPLAPDGTVLNNPWDPGLWKVDAATGSYQNVDIHLSSADLLDAQAAPDGRQIIYSTSEGLGEGSEIWSMNSDGSNQRLLLRLAGNPQSIAGMFAWSPDGRSVAYERLADSPVPYLPASIWVMDSQGQHQRYLASGDGGHGFALSWSPNGHAIAFVSRVNADDSQANEFAQALQSGVGVVNVESGRVHLVASPLQTGVQINTDPAWSIDSTQITFVAANPFNPAFGGSARYWSVDATDKSMIPAALPLTPALQHVIAFT
jgi:Tol biopolymer transport system component